MEGDWPNPVTITAGWARARVRPWNEVVTSPMVRLDRGGPDFLMAVTKRLAEMGEPETLSPALYAGTTRVWRRAGFEDHASLEVMERSLTSGANEPGAIDVAAMKPVVWRDLAIVDRSAFEGFWGMSIDGLRDAVAANRRSVVMCVRDGPRVVGYAIVGSQWGTAYLHRIAVDADSGGRGIGGAILARSINWARSEGAKTIVLNVRPENSRARRVYERHAFASTGSALTVLRHRAASC